MTRALLIAMVMLGMYARVAAADVQRFAVVIGNDTGQGDEATLRYATDDADKVEGVLGDLGGFPAENIVSLRDKTADAARRAIISINDRIRAASGDTMLLVYYSGHADAAGLHLGKTTFANDELLKLVRGSPATIRLLVIDSCRSGAVTRAKGGTAAAEFDLAVDESLAGEGAIFLSSSAADEDSQESDDIKGSFFTHYLVSGLLGSADSDGDGAVAVDEAYRYAYENTLRASSRSAAGLQHPAFQYDVRGQGKIILTRLAATARDRAQLTFPDGRTYVLFEGSGKGAVVAEVGADAARRTLSVRAGTYFVRGRGADDLLEGSVSLAAGKTVELKEAGLERVEFARLVRKGGGGRVAAHAMSFGLIGHSDLYDAGGACAGAALGYRLELPAVSLLGRVAGCGGGYANAFLSARTLELDASLGAVHVWDVAPLALEVGVGAGAAWLHQGFTTRGVAPSRDTLAPHVELLAGATLDVSRRWFVGLQARAATYFVRRTEGTDPTATVTPIFTLGADLSVGRRY